MEPLSERMRSWSTMEFYNVRKIIDAWADEVEQRESRIVNYKNSADTLLLAIGADKQVEANVWNDYLHWLNELDAVLEVNNET